MKHQSIAAEHDGAGTDSRDTPRVRHLNLCILRALRQRAWLIRGLPDGDRLPSPHPTTAGHSIRSGGVPLATAHSAGAFRMEREIILEALHRARPYSTIAYMHYGRRERPIQTRRAA